MGYLGDFKFKRLKDNKIRVIDVYTRERVGEFYLDDEDININPFRKKRGKK